MIVVPAAFTVTTTVSPFLTFGKSSFSTPAMLSISDSQPAVACLIVTSLLTESLSSVIASAAASAYAARMLAASTASLDFSNCEEKIGIFLFK